MTPETLVDLADDMMVPKRGWFRKKILACAEQWRADKRLLLQAKGALGYPVPGDIPEGDFVNGIADALGAQLATSEQARQRAEELLRECVDNFDVAPNAAGWIGRVYATLAQTKEE